MNTKIFGIGLHKTGTSTLRECLKILGYNVYPEEDAYMIRMSVIEKKYRSCLMLAKRYEAFEDSPWNYMDVFRILDAVFPDAKFILTSRNEEIWFKSILRWVCLHDSASEINLINTLGIAPFPENKTNAINAFHKHNSNVVDYFCDRVDKLLIVDWEQGDGWEKLCAFLNKPIPDIPFPCILKYDPNTVSYIK